MLTVPTTRASRQHPPSASNAVRSNQSGSKAKLRFSESMKAFPEIRRRSTSLKTYTEKTEGDERPGELLEAANLPIPRKAASQEANGTSLPSWWRRAKHSMIRQGQKPEPPAFTKGERPVLSHSHDKGTISSVHCDAPRVSSEQELSAAVILPPSISTSDTSSSIHLSAKPVQEYQISLDTEDIDCFQLCEQFPLPDTTVPRLCPPQPIEKDCKTTLTSSKTESKTSDDQCNLPHRETDQGIDWGSLDNGAARLDLDFELEFSALGSCRRRNRSEPFTRMQHDLAPPVPPKSRRTRPDSNLTIVPAKVSSSSHGSQTTLATPKVLFLCPSPQNGANDAASSVSTSIADSFGWRSLESNLSSSHDRACPYDNYLWHDIASAIGDEALTSLAERSLDEVTLEDPYEKMTKPKRESRLSMGARSLSQLSPTSTPISSQTFSEKSAKFAAAQVHIPLDHFGTFPAGADTLLSELHSDWYETGIGQEHSRSADARCSDRDFMRQESSQNGFMSTSTALAKSSSRKPRPALPIPNVPTPEMSTKLSSTNASVSHQAALRSASSSKTAFSPISSPSYSFSYPSHESTLPESQAIDGRPISFLTARDEQSYDADLGHIVHRDTSYAI